MRRFNDWVARSVTNGTATMACFWLFLAIAAVSAPQAIGSHNPVVMVNWLSSNCIQLILLPVLAYGQKSASAKHDATQASLDALHTKHDLNAHRDAMHERTNAERVARAIRTELDRRRP